MLKSPVWVPVAAVLVAAQPSAQPSSVVLETESFKYVLGADGKNLGFVDKKSGEDYCDHAAPSHLAELRHGGKTYLPSSLSRDGQRLILEFAGSKTRVTLEAIPHRRHLELGVASVSGDLESLVFLDLPLRLQGRPAEPFGACALALNLVTRVDQLPALQSRLRASCYSRFGVAGAKVAVVGAPPDEILSVLKRVVRNAKELPQTTASGPWAKDVPFNRGSYLFNFGALTEDNVVEWVDMVKSLGFNQIDCHGGGSRFFRFGDFHLNPEKWPQGWDNYKNIVAKLHEENIGAIFHTYCFFIDKRSKYVSPVPRSELGAFRSFTLAEPVSAGQKEITVVESTRDVPTITGFFVRNSVTLHVGDELVTFGNATREPPYRFTACQRGAHGTRAVAHPRGAKARHLKECFGLFVPDPESALFEEIAANHARVVNHCKFDGIYLDAIDGSDILGGAENSWYYGSKFLYAIWKHLERPVGMEMSSMWHHFWQFRSRWQAWDYPNRGHKRFIDMHASAVNGGLLLPLHLGWWNFQTFAPPQVEPSYPDVVEYLGARLVGHDAGISLTGAVDRRRLETVPAIRRLVALLRRYEELRHGGYFDDSVKAKLREPGKEFTLFQDVRGAWRFRPARFDRHKVCTGKNRSETFEAENEHGAQPVKLRIEALMSTGPYEASGNVVLADSSGVGEPGGLRTARGVEARIEPCSNAVDGRPAAMLFAARSAGQVPRKAAWVKAEKKFEPWLDLGSHQALGVWIHGDGQGELLNFRLESPRHIAHGAIADRYVKVDFRGWRCFELVETESSRYSDYSWPDGWALYHVYRELVNFTKIESLSIWYQNLPPGREARCYLTPVRALPMKSATFRNPRVTLGGKTVVFPVAMRSGDYLELYSPQNCKLYDPKGKLREEVSPDGEIPRLQEGKNTITFSCEGPEEGSARVHVTVISFGEPL